jgi:hypothetical protein
MARLLAPFAAWTLLLTGSFMACSQGSPSTPVVPSAGSGGAGAGAGAGGAATAGATSGAAGADGVAGTTGGALGSGGSGGSATSGGASAGSAGQAGAGGMGGGDPCVGALYCDDFDSYPASGNPGGPWVTSTQYSGNMNGTVSIDATHAYSGASSVHFAAPGSTSFEHAFISLQGAPYFPVANNTFFGRMMIYVTKLPASTVHWTMIEGLGTMVPGFPELTEVVYRYGGQINGDQLMANYDNKPTHGDCAQRSTTKVPKNAWTCVEWRFDGALKELDFWMDGVKNEALSVKQEANDTGTCQNEAWSGIWEPPTFSSIAIGFQHYQQGAGELWIDDFAIDTQKIGCPAASLTAK